MAKTATHLNSDENSKKQLIVRWLRENFVSVLTVMAVLSAAVTIRTLVMPLENQKQVVAQQIKHQVTFGHWAQPKASSLYSASQPISQQQRYMTKLTDHFYVTIKSNATVTSDIPVTGSARVVLKLIAGELWERDYILAPDKPFSGAGDIELLNGTYEIPVTQLWAFADQVGKEADIRPNAYTLTVEPIIVTDAGQGNGSPLEFSPSYSFELSERELIPKGALTASRNDPKGDLYQEKVFATKKTEITPATTKIAISEMPVSSARTLFGVITVALIGAILMLSKRYPKTRPVMAEAVAISKKYRSRIVNAAGTVSTKGLTFVPLKSFKELLAIADEREKRIVRLDDVDKPGVLCRFCVMDEWTIFCYEAPTEPTNGGATLPDRNITGTGS